jgi:hypothetical protein
MKAAKSSIMSFKEILSTYHHAYAKKKRANFDWFIQE